MLLLAAKQSKKIYFLKHLHYIIRQKACQAICQRKFFVNKARSEFVRSEPCLHSYSTANIIFFASLKHCIPRGIPIKVVHSRAPNTINGIPPSRPAKNIQRILPNGFMLLPPCFCYLYFVSSVPILYYTAALITKKPPRMNTQRLFIK